MRYILILLCLLASACATKNPPKLDASQADDTKNNSENYATIRVVKKSNVFDTNIIWSNIVSITRYDGINVYKSSPWGLKAVPFVTVPEGRYRIKFTCHSSGGWNDNYMKIEPLAGQDYTVFCLKENRGKTIFGDTRMVALHPFFERTDEVDIKREQYQKIIDNPQKSDLAGEVPKGSTRIIFYYEPTSFLGSENRYRYSVFINGRVVDKIDALKYTYIELPNDEYDFEMRNDGLLATNKAKAKINADGGDLYMKCQEGLIVPLKCEILKEKPDDFDTKVKPMHIFQY